MELSFGSFVDSGPEVAQVSQVQATRPGSSHPVRTASAQQRPSSAAHPPVQQRPSSAHPSGKSSRVQSAYPSEQLKDVLSKLGTLNDRHERLKSIVEELQVSHIYFHFDCNSNKKKQPNHFCSGKCLIN